MIRLLLAILPVLATSASVQESGPFFGPLGSAGSISLSHVQSCSFISASSSTTTVSVTCGSAIGAGHLLFFSVSSYNAGSSAYKITAPTFTGDSGTVTSDPNCQNVGSTTQGQWFSSFWILSTSGGGATFTVTSTTAMGYPAISIDEWVFPSAALDVEDTPNLQANPNPAASNSITPSVNGDLIVGTGSGCCGGGNSIIQGTGYAMGGSNVFPAGQEYFAQSTAAPITATFTFNSVPSYSVTHIVAFK